ncbi:unnamed protein product [Ilex paraguariensis]|uniref:Uncharacterized protein n=1 Tax=Ilex paraguariensis TaxID=185542 RepID=A0ABC8T2C5_9AQUA
MECLFQFQQYIAGDLGQFQSLEVYNSDNMEAILAINVEGAAAEEDEIVLHKLKDLCLENLPNLVSFFFAKQIVRLQKAVLISEHMNLCSMESIGELLYLWTA